MTQIVNGSTASANLAACARSPDEPNCHSRSLLVTMTQPALIKCHSRGGGCFGACFCRGGGGGGGGGGEVLRGPFGC